jgi:DNA-binding NtrC family response regulator
MLRATVFTESPRGCPGRRTGLDPGAESQIVAAGVAVILHERLGNWSRQLRPRLHGRGIRWFETRSASDLDEALAERSTPIVVIDLAGRTLDGLADLERIRDRAPGSLILVLDPEARDEVGQLARELGATYVFSGAVPPPEISCLLSRWIDLASTRASRDGWSRSDDLDTLPEPWNWLTPYLKGTP